MSALTTTTIIPCPACGQNLRVPAVNAGSTLRVRCPGCAHRFAWTPPSGDNLPAVRRNREPVRPADEWLPTVARMPSGGELTESPQYPDKIQVTRVQEQRDLAMPEWFAAPHGFGQMAPRLDTAPATTELHLLDFRCSHTGRAFRQTYAKTRLGHPFRLVDNGDAESFLRLARDHGCRIGSGLNGVVAMSDFDWSNWQCQDCGHGVIAGSRHNFFRCGQCGTLNCARSIHYPRGAAASCVCGNPACGYASVLQETLEAIAGTRHVSHQPR